MGPCVRRDDDSAKFSARRRQCTASARLVPGPLRRGEPDQSSLDVVAAPVAQKASGLVVLNPLGDRLDFEPPRQIDQRLHEGAVIGRARDVLHKGAVDLHDIDAELAQIAERSVTGAEIVDCDPAAEILQPGDEAADVVDILDRDGFGDFDDQPLARRRDAPASAIRSRSDQSGSIVVAGEMLRLSCTVRRHRKFGNHQFEHPMIDQAYQAKLLGDREQCRAPAST